MHLVRLIPDWNSLDSVRHAHSFLEAVALVFFGLLVFFDVLAHFSEDEKRERLLEKLGLCFFAVAVFAEIAAYPYGQRNDTLSEQIIGSLDIKAGNADKRAQSAVEKSEAAETKADEIQERLDKALTQLGMLERAVSAQGPRWNLLERKGGEFIKALKPFAGQEVLVEYCGSLLSAPPEQSELAWGLLKLFNDSGQSGAGWKASPAPWDSCPPNGAFGIGGNLVLTSAVAAESVKRAAAALAATLNRVGISTQDSEGVAATSAQVMRAVVGSGSPWELAVRDPASIVLFIEPNPMHSPIARKKASRRRQNAKP